MSSSLQKKADSRVRPVSDEEAAVLPDNARSTDESPTVISKTAPIIETRASSKNGQVSVRMSRESIIADLRGRRLAHFELVEWVGEGGMAAVIRARDTQLDRFVALKILPPDMAAEKDNVQRFHQEAKAAAKLDHENIARVFFCGEDHGLHFIAFEFVEGMTLRTMLDKRGRIPVAEAIRYILQVAAGLEHAATRGVVHRDVKPSNIIITPTGRAKLVDMGLARNMERHSERDLTQSGVTLGTFDYISPEQALEPREADSRSDIYSLGCTLYHLLTGQPPVPDGTPAKKLHHHQNVAPVDPRSIDPIIPEDLVMILGKMMAKDPKDRYQRPIHLVHHLLKIAHRVGIADEMPEGVLVVDAPLPSEPRSRPLMWVGLALTLLVAFVMAMSMFPESRIVVPVNPDAKANGAKPPILVQDKGGKKTQPALKPERVLAAEVNTADELKRWLDDKTAREIPIEGEFELKSNLVHQGGPNQQLVLKANDPANLATIKFSYQLRGDNPSLILEGNDVTFRRIRFLINASANPEDAVGAVIVRGARRVTFDRCIFVQNEMPAISPLSKRLPLASVLIENGPDADAAPPNVNFNECLFDSNKDGGQAAVAINGPANVKATNCAFKPHHTLFHFREGCTFEKTAVALDYCSSFVTRGPAFRLTNKATAEVQARRSLFSRPDSSIKLAGQLQPDLVYLPEGTGIHYSGDGNLYHNLNFFVGKSPGKKPIDNFDDFRNFLVKTGSDLRSQNIPESDLAASPLLYPSGTSAENPFLLKAGYHEKYGLQVDWTGKKLTGPEPIVVKTPRPKIIVDAATVNLGEFKTLGAALLEAQDGDTIWIKHGDERNVEVASIELKPGVSVTVRPFSDDYHPVLKLAKTDLNRDAYMFKITEGFLKLSQLEVLLDPENDDVTQSIAYLGELGQLEFSNCVLTLRAPGKVQLNVALYFNSTAMLKMKSPRPTSPRVDFNECFIRGKGDLVTLRGCRLLDVKLENSLVALNGSLLEIDAADQKMATSQGVTFNMKRSSIFTADSAFLLRANNGTMLTGTSADAQNSILAALVPDMPAVYLEVDKTLTEASSKYFQWTGQQNFIANYQGARVLDPNFRMELNRLTFKKLVEDKTLVHKLWDATPDWFKPTELEKVNGFGIPADVEKRLLPDPDE